MADGYEAALAWLYALDAARGMDFKLERVQLALESLRQPQRRYPCVHIAGTNGKGSVAAMTHAMLSAAGYRVGLYTSPHLVRFTERIRVGAEEITDEAVVDLVARIRADVTGRGIDLTFFEFATVMAFVHFAQRAVDVAVVEVGLGGRLDSTNVIDPAVAVVTTIGLDHQEYLGNSIEQIAAEKGGIIKSGRPTVFGRLDSHARPVLTAIAAERQSGVVELGVDFGMSEEDRPSYNGLRHRLPALTLGLRGRYQRDNAATALAAIECLPTGLCVAEAAMRHGLAHVRWPGRLEIVSSEPLIVLDGAHNPAGVEALVRELKRLLRGRRVWLVFGVMRDKVWSSMVQTLAEIADEVVVTEVLPPRGESPERLATAFGALRPTSVIRDPVAALEYVRAAAHPRDAIVVAGSLFLVGAVYPHLTVHTQAGAPAAEIEAP